MRLSILVPVLLAASLTWACGDSPAPDDSGEAGQINVKSEEGSLDACTNCMLGLEEEVPAEADAATAVVLTVRLAVSGMG